METKTSIAQEIDWAGENARYDASCKKVLSEKIILAWIMKGCLEEFRTAEVEEIAGRYIEGTPQVSEIPVNPDEAPRITGSSTEDSSLQEGTISYDIRFLAAAPKAGRLIRLIVNVEAQNDFYPGYPLIKRGIYYGCRMISSQYGTEFTDSHYENIRKVTSIWICMNPPVNRENSITLYRITESDPVGSVTEPVEHYDLMTVFMICLGDPAKAEGSELLRLLDVLFSNEIRSEEKKQILQDEFDIPMTQTLSEEVNRMSNLAQGVWEKGRRAGIEEGIEEGIEKGEMNMMLRNLRSLMQTLEVSADQAMETLGVPKEEQGKYARLLTESLNVI